MRHFLFRLLLLGTALDGALAQYALQIGNVAWPGGYRCFSGTEYPNTVNFTLAKTENGSRAYAVTAGPSTTTGNFNRQLSSGLNRLNYQLYPANARSFILKAPPSATANEVISGRSHAQAGTGIPLSFLFCIPPGQIVFPGTYTDSITVSVYRNYNDPGNPMNSRTITLSAVVIPEAVLAVVPRGSGFSDSTSQNLNFGTLTQGQRLGCDLLVRRNTGCNLTFSSLNNGVLKAIPTPTTDQVPYVCTVNGTRLNLATRRQISLPAGLSSSADGERLPIDITIGNLADAAAGDYQDQIVIAVVAN